VYVAFADTLLHKLLLLLCFTSLTISAADELKHVRSMSGRSLTMQSIVDAAISQWRRRL